MDGYDVFYKGKFFNAIVVAIKTFDGFRSLATNEIEYKQAADISSLLTARFGKDLGKAKTPYQPINIYNHTALWKSKNVTVSYRPSTDSGSGDRFSGQSVIDFMYLPIAHMKAADIEEVKKAALDSRKADIMKAADFLQPTKDVWVGFRGIKWGADISSCPDMTVLKDHGDGLIEYIRKADIGATLAGVPFDRILYSFYQGRFGWSTIFPRDDDENLYAYDQTFREILAARYDPTFMQREGRYTEKNGIRYDLKDPTRHTHKDVLVYYAGKWSYGYNSEVVYPATHAIIIYLPIAEQKDKDDKNKRKAAEQIRREKLKDATKSSF